MKVIAVVGDYYHEESLYKDMLVGIFERKEEADLSFASRDSLLDELKNRPDLVILASENRLEPEKDETALWLTEEGAKKIAAYVEDGGAWLAWHSGLAGYDKLPSYITMLGGYFTHHPEDHIEVTYTYSSHPLTKDEKESFALLDEHYFIKRVNPINVFSVSSSIEGESVSGWTKTIVNGKVAGYTPSHTKEGLASAELRDDLSRLIDWCLSKV